MEEALEHANYLRLSEQKRHIFCQSFSKKIYNAQMKKAKLRNIFRDIFHELMILKTRIHKLFFPIQDA